jgi:hypothetical protein
LKISSVRDYYAPRPPPPKITLDGILGNPHKAVSTGNSPNWAGEPLILMKNQKPFNRRRNLQTEWQDLAISAKSLLKLT